MLGTFRIWAAPRPSLGCSSGLDLRSMALGAAQGGPLGAQILNVPRWGVILYQYLLILAPNWSKKCHCNRIFPHFCHCNHLFFSNNGTGIGQKCHCNRFVTVTGVTVTDYPCTVIISPTECIPHNACPVCGSLHAK